MDKGGIAQSLAQLGRRQRDAPLISVMSAPAWRSPQASFMKRLYRNQTPLSCDTGTDIP